MRALVIVENQHYKTIFGSALKRNNFSDCRLEFFRYDLKKTNVGLTFDGLLFFIEHSEDLNGLEIAKEIIRNNQFANVILLLDEQRIDYSMAAMRIGVKNIILKSDINENVITELVKNFCESEESHIDKKQYAQKTLEKMLFYNDSKNYKNNGEILNNLFKLKENNKKFYLLLLSSLDIVERSENDAFEKRRQFEKAVQDINGIASEKLEIQYVFYIDNFFYILITGVSGFSLAQEERITTDILHEFQNLLIPVVGENTIIFSSKPRANFNDLYRSISELEDAKSMLHLYSFPHVGTSLHLRKNDNYDRNFNALIEKTVKMIYAVEKNSADYKKSIDSIFSMNEMQLISESYFQKFKEYLRFEFEIIKKKRADSLSGVEAYNDLLSQILLQPNFSLLKKVVEQISCLLIENNKNKYNHLITKCIKFISENYMSKIGLYEAAAELNISTVYLSQLFKKETSRNFNEYLNEYRLVQAQKLIDEGSYTLLQICDMCGFNNVQYFNSKFKKHFGCTPSAYKNR